jgi:LacI family transcriptional regulator
VVNDYPFIRPEIRERVQKVIAQTGFKPNLAARSLVSNRSNIIGLIIPSVVQKVFTDPYFPYLIDGIARGCNANGLILSLYLFHSLEEEKDVPQAILGTGLVGGLIFTADRRYLGMLDALLEGDIPLVLIGQPEDDMPEISFVDIDNHAGAYMATKHLIDLGYKRIATIAAHINKSSEQRFDAYKQALSDHGIPIDKRFIAHGDFSIESGYQAAKTLIPQSPDAIFAANDSMALGAMRAIREAGLSVPHDIAIVGFDDLPGALQAEPPLTTIHQPVQQSGIEAVKILHAMLNDELEKPAHIFLPNTLIVRGSTRGSV